MDGWITNTAWRRAKKWVNTKAEEVVSRAWKTKKGQHGCISSMNWNVKGNPMLLFDCLGMWLLNCDETTARKKAAALLLKSVRISRRAAAAAEDETA